MAGVVSRHREQGEISTGAAKLCTTAFELEHLRVMFG
jgi:hypothetical protein